MQTEFNIEWEDSTEKFTCVIDGEKHKLFLVLTILNIIADLYDYVYEEQYSESHYKIMLEEDLGIKVNFNFDY